MLGHDALTDDPEALPGAYLLRVADFLAAPLPAPMRLALAAPTARVALPAVNTLLQLALARPDPAPLARLLAGPMQAPLHGYLGFAAMTAPTIGAALDLVVRFAPLRTTAAHIALSTTDDFAILELSWLSPLSPLREVVLLALAVGFLQMAQTLTGTTVSGHAEFDFDPTSLSNQQVSTLHSFTTLTFNTPQNRLLFPRATLDLPLLMADSAASAAATAQCEHALAELCDFTHPIARTRRLLATRSPPPSLPDVAAALHLSPRTLKRNLAAARTSFRALRDQALTARAARLLANPALTLDAIAEHLGYSDAANFSRAFRRWTGHTPRALPRLPAP